MRILLAFIIALVSAAALSIIAFYGSTLFLWSKDEYNDDFYTGILSGLNSEAIMMVNIFTMFTFAITFLAVFIRRL